MRILLVPVVVVALLDATPNGSWLAAGVVALAGLTEGVGGCLGRSGGLIPRAALNGGVDGYLVRSWGSITNFGKVMDPIADKLLIAAALISLVSLDRLEAWVAMVIIAREFAVSGLRVAAGAQGAVIPANKLGKLKTVLQVGTVFT